MAKRKSGPVPIIGIDAEWSSASNFNKLLSYQWFGIDGDREWSGIHYAEWLLPESKNRLSLDEWLAKALMDGFKNRKWPEHVVLASHYTPAEMSVVKGFDKLKYRIDLVQGSNYASIQRPFKAKCYDKSNNKHEVWVTLMDSMLLAPPDALSLAALGELLGFPKVELPDGFSKNDMRDFQIKEPELFEEYAIRDAEITARYIKRIELECGDLGLDTYRPVTVGSLAVKTLLKKLTDDGVDYDAVMGVEKKSVKIDKHSESKRTYKNKLAERHEDLAIKSYHGGRNECFLFGFHDGLFTDWDLEGAYSTALAAYVEPDFDELKETTDPNDFTHDTYGYALVSWKFDSSTKYPCLFQRDPNGHGLIYVLEGQEYLTSPEIALARRMGADITIQSGVVVPPKDDGVRPFLSLSQWVNSQRKQYPKKTHPFENSFYKLIGNNVYGKVAQGLKSDSRVFDSRMGSTKELERSKLSDAFAAAYTTGLVRATTSEILSELPDDVTVGNTITDGICSTASEQQMLDAIKGPQCQFFSNLRKLICGDPKMIESKGASNGMVFMRVRMHASLDGNRKDKKPILAAVNIQLDKEQSNWEKNDQLISMFKDREWDSEQETSSLTTARKIWDTEGDLLNDERVRSVRMDYDLKRKPKTKTAKMQRDHLAFETQPFSNHADYAKYRAELDKYKEPFKLIGDLDEFLQQVHTRGTGKNKNRGKSRLNQYANDVRDRAAVGVDGLVNENGGPLKPKQIDELVTTITNGKVEIKADQIRKVRSRINSGDTELKDGYIEVTISVSLASEQVKKMYPAHKGLALKRSSKIEIVDE